MFNRFAVVAIVLFMSIIPGAPPAAFSADIATELRGAQKMLAKGDYENAYAEFLRFAEKKNNPLAQFTLGLFFKNGWHGPEDPAAACGWFEKAAEGGIPTAAHLSAECLDKGTAGTADPAEAARLYQKAADLGHIISLCSLGELYMEGRGVPKDPGKGIALCREAAGRGSIPAQVRLGRLFLEKEPPVRDYDKAFSMFSSAANSNHPEALYYLGVMLRDGLGRPPSPESARLWFERAAAGGFSAAYHPTGALYFTAPADPQTGKLSAHDLAKAYLWLSAASKRPASPADKTRNREMLTKVISVMPESWAPDLDAKVEKHLAAHPEAE